MRPAVPPSASESPSAVEASSAYAVHTGAWRVRDIPERLRPREEIERMGVEHVSDEVLLAVILRSGTRGCSVVDLARELIREYGSLTALAMASGDDLRRKKGLGKVKAQVLQAALELARRLGEEAAPKRCLVRTPQDVAGLLQEKARTLETEVFWVLQLDAKNHLRRPPVEISRGLLDASLVHPREVFRDAIRAASAAVILAHNHPSGDPVPSAEDLRITRQLVDAGRIVDIRVLDHVVLGRPGDGTGRAFLSMREEGLASFA